MVKLPRQHGSLQFLILPSSCLYRQWPNYFFSPLSHSKQPFSSILVSGPTNLQTSWFLRSDVLFSILQFFSMSIFYESCPNFQSSAPFLWNSVSLQSCLVYTLMLFIRIYSTVTSIKTVRLLNYSGLHTVSSYNLKFTIILQISSRLIDNISFFFPFFHDNEDKF